MCGAGRGRRPAGGAPGRPQEGRGACPAAARARGPPAGSRTSRGRPPGARRAEHPPRRAGGRETRCPLFSFKFRLLVLAAGVGWGPERREDFRSVLFLQMGAFKLHFSGSAPPAQEPSEGSVGLKGKMKACDIRNGSVFSCKANLSIHRGCYQRTAGGFCGLAMALGGLFQTVP